VPFFLFLYFFLLYIIFREPLTSYFLMNPRRSIWFLQSFRPGLSRAALSVVFACVFIFFTTVCDTRANGQEDIIPSLDETIRLALKLNTLNSSGKAFHSPEEVTFLVKKYYYQIQTQLEQLDIAEEVQGHFEKAVNKSEEILEEGEGEVSQSDITKLKLGLSDTLNDIVGLKHEMHVAKLSLGRLIGRELTPDTRIVEKDVLPVEFSPKNFEDFLKTAGSPTGPESASEKTHSVSNSSTSTLKGKLDGEDLLTLHKTFIAVDEAREKVKLGKRNRRITRALLVAEVANYDFGIGDSGSLFEALIIYTRVLSGYYNSIYTFNLAVAELEKTAALTLK